MTMEQTGTSAGAPPRRRLLVLDTSYTLEMIRQRSLEDSLTCRDLDGFFEHVWTVHPFASLLTSEQWAPKFGRYEVTEINARHTFIEGKVGRFRALSRFFLPNFALAQLTIFFALLRLIRKERIDVMRVSSPLYLGAFAWALARLSGIPFVIRVGGNHDKLFETTGQPIEPRLMRTRRIEKAVERFVFPRADLVAGANQDNLDFALANGARPERSTLFRYGNLIDKRHFADPATRPVDPAILAEHDLRPRGYLLYIGRLESLKHPDDVIRVLKFVRDRGHDVAALLVGDGSMRPRLEEIAAEHDVAEHVVMPGNKDQGWLAQIVAQAAVVVSPHTGRALSEAALAAAPIAAYDVDWQGELIHDGETGALVPHKDWRALAERTERFLADPDHARRMGDAVRRRALDMLDPAALDEHERQHYSALLDRWRRGRA